MKSSVFLHRIAYYFLLCIIILGCTEEQVPIAVTSITLDSTSITLVEGENHTLTATISPSNAENQKVLWSSNTSSVASVKDGIVTAIKVGTATITAKSDDGGKTATCEVTVSAKVYPVTEVTLNKTSYEMTEGDEFTLTATVNPENATNKNVSWSSSNTSVATVDNGKVTALTTGTATITVKTEDGNKTATCEITVNAKVYPVTGVTLNKTSYEMTEGDEVTLTATVSPENATNKNVSWSSSNTSVATVDNGKVKALKAGTATITVKTEDGDMTATCEFIIMPLTRIDLSSSGTSNCYIVSTPGAYKFIPTKGNSSECVGDIVSTSVLWESYGTNVTIDVGDLICDVTYQDGVIMFNTSKSFNKGNAVIAALDSSAKILWSWHIWLTDQPVEQIYYNNAGIMMDRNLGATSATPGAVTAFGLIYQWGRKDPFLNSSSKSSYILAKSTISWPIAVESDESYSTIEYAIANPTTYIAANSTTGEWYFPEGDGNYEKLWTEHVKTREQYTCLH